MRRLVAAVFVSLVALPAWATNVIGNINTNTRWTVANSPYYLQGDVIVAPQATLTIDPGVTVTAATSDQLAANNDTSRVEFIVRGELVANGTAANPIVFNAAAGNRDTWVGITFDIGAATSSLTFANVSSAITAVSVKTGNSPTITDDTIATSTNGITWQSAATANLARLNISNFFSNGILLQDDGMNGLTATVSSSTIQGSTPSTIAVNVATRVNATVKRNLIAMNGTGVSADAGSTLTLVNNVVAGNAVAGASVAQTGTNAISITNNTFDQNFSKSSGIGLNLTVTNTATFIVRNNNVTTHNVGIKVAGSAQPSLDSNNVWNNTTNYSGVTNTSYHGAQSTNPLYVNPIGTLPATQTWTSVNVTWSCAAAYPNAVNCSPIDQYNAGFMRISGASFGPSESLTLRDRTGSGSISYSSGTSGIVTGNEIQLSLYNSGYYTAYTTSISQIQYLPLTYDYHLQASSPVIDTGNDLGAPTEDLDGVTRPYDGDVNGTATTDIGAYEFHQNIAPTAIAGKAQTALPNMAVSFDGSGSYDPDGTLAKFDWDFGDGSAHSNAVAPTHTYTATGMYTVKLAVTDNNGATGTDQTTVNVVNNLPPVAKAGSNQLVAIGATVTLDGSNSYDPNDTIVAYQWDFGDGTTKGNMPKVTHVYNTQGTYTATLTVTDSFGATNSATVLIGVGTGGTTNSPPVAKAGAAQTVALGQAVTLDGSASTDSDGTIASYAWDLGDGHTKTGKTVTYTYANVGTFIVTLTVTDNQGATGSATTSVTVTGPSNQPPVAKPGGLYAAMLGQSIAFDGSASSDPDGSIASFHWDFGDGTSASTVTATHTYAAAGSFLVQLTVTDNLGLSASASVLASVIAPTNKPPTADAGGPYAALVGHALLFDASKSSDPDGSIASFHWDFGDGTSGSGKQAMHTYMTAGSFLVQLTVTDNEGASDTQAVLASISTPTHRPPVAKAGGNRTAKVGEALTFDASASTAPDGSIVSYQWDFGDGQTATAAFVTHTYMEPQSYLVKLTVTDDQGATGQDIAIVTVTSDTSMGGNKPPVAVAGKDVSGNAGQKLVFNASGSSDPDGNIVAYQWDFGDGNSAAGLSVTHAYEDGGTYTVTLTVFDNLGAKATATLTATINSLPVADAGMDRQATVGQSITFDGSASTDKDGHIASYKWSFGDGGVATGVSAKYVYGQVGTYTVTLTVTDDKGAQGTTTLKVFVTDGSSSSSTDTTSRSKGGCQSSGEAGLLALLGGCALLRRRRTA